MPASQLIVLIEDQGLLDPSVVAELRRQVAQSQNRISAEALVKLLVDNEQLTKFQGTRLISQLNEQRGGSSENQKFLKPLSVGEPSPGSLGADEEDSMLPEDLVPKNRVSESTTDGVPDATLIDQVDDVEIIDESEMVEVDMVDEPDEISHEIEDAEEYLEDVEEVEEVEAFDEGEDAVEEGEVSDEPEETKINTPIGVNSTKKHEWDAFRIWGFGAALAFLVTAFVGLGFWFTSQGAEDSYKKAVEAYENHDYDVAIERFKGFAESFASDSRASNARVFEVLAMIHQSNDQLGEPVKAIEICEEELPRIVNEPAINDLMMRADLGTVLVSIGEKLVQRADGAKTTADRKALIDELDRHFVSLRNPQFLPNAQRVTNEVRIKSIEENRERLLRNVRLAEDNATALETMKKAIAEGNVDAAYTARRNVVRDYPELKLDKPLLELLQQATSLQQQKVESTKEIPEVVESVESKTVGRSVFLVKQSGKPLNVSPDAIHVVKAKRAIYGLRANDGAVLWRRPVGMETVSDPLRMTSDFSADTLIVSPAKGRLARLNSLDGKSLWELQFKNSLLAPLVDSEIIFASTKKGQVYSIDGESGQIRWSKQLPQSMDVGIGGGTNKQGRYCLGEHSNLFVLSRSDGSCKQVYYLGHTAGTIAIPPVFTLGYLLVFENATPGYCTMHILKVGDQGGELSLGQKSITLEGHVVVPPTLDGRRMVVVTDLGELTAYDIEPANPGDKVNRIARIGRNESNPRIAWPSVAGNELWIASNRFTRYQIQVSRQQLVSDWVREEEDQFVGRATKIEDYVIHSRSVRGTRGIRVAAVNGLTGDAVWETDLGVPLVAVQGGASGVAAINSQAAYYAISGKALVAGNPINASENPGRNNRVINFDNPVVMPSGKTALLNMMQGAQVAVYDPKGAPGASFLINSLQINSGTPSQPPVVAGNGLVIPLSNAQLAYIDPASGKQLGTPYQPTLQTGVETRWIAPVTLADGQTVVAATNQNKIHRLSSGKQLRSLTEAPTAMPLVGRLAVANDIVCAVSRGESQDSLELYNGSDLARISGTEQDGRISWGPYAVAEQFIAYSETSGMASIDLKGKTIWKNELPNVAMIGAPLVDGSELLIASVDGRLFRVDLTTGQIKAKIVLDEPISGQLTTLGPQVLIPGAEGVLLAIPMDSTRKSFPDTAEATP